MTRFAVVGRGGYRVAILRVCFRAAGIGSHSSRATSTYKPLSVRA